MNPLLSIKNLKSYFFMDNKKVVKAVNNVSFDVRENEIFGLVGESGCGKSVTSLSILNLLKGQGKIVDGSIEFLGENLIGKSEKYMNTIRGNRISMIFQDPISFLNPLMKIGDQIIEVILRHEKISRSLAKNKALELIKSVQIPEPENRLNSYAHQLSGGLRQRVLIAIAIANNPKLLIADEPTTALDVTVQKEIINLLLELKKKSGMSIIFITHDLALISKIADRIAVMYAGKIVEIGTASDLFKNPYHPYTKALLASIPSFAKKDERLFSLEGSVPNLDSLPNYCSFTNRCLSVSEQCYNRIPELITVGTRKVACCLYNK